MSLPATPQLRWSALRADDLDALLAVENQCYSHPWTRGNFIDSMAMGYAMQLLWADEALIGYFVAMQGVDELHLLNITVNPQHQRQGWAKVLLEQLRSWAVSARAQAIWLEVRISNLRAQQIYLQFGFESVGLRKRYYPVSHVEREDAMVMRYLLPTTP
ncbi:MAG: ribosomal protein S18-alanine N-acetyltransferase [Comamonas sp.]|jgi:ribosomal-protein-alanine N-acetyltransferase|uniref:ribosomal protein S18-alanine N-acetyltransferase n=1 Tax=unclassified Comamonas TaxID=2638500 RepID=UPI001EFBD3CA|nr:MULTISPECIES: ribosomal protein S18-alanine N-acetyltransferase [unclassified Comamonas]ULR88367.1 ribosomal protein S18-alanine N-acetyltransferase [Comamonas sp. B21-038]